MGKAWEAFQKLADEGKIVFEVDRDGLPYWAWLLLALLITTLYILINFVMGYRQGLRGCDLLIHTLAALFIAMNKVMRRGNAQQTGHDQSGSTEYTLSGLRSVV